MKLTKEPKAEKVKEPKAKKVKEPKAKKEKAPKVPKAPKAKKGKKGAVAEETTNLDDAFGAEPVARARKQKVKKYQPKAPKDVYTLVLLLSFIFFVASAVLMYLDVASYK